MPEQRKYAISAALMILEAAHASYGGVFGWTFNIGSVGGAQVIDVAPQIGMTTQPEAGSATPGVILCYRVSVAREEPRSRLTRPSSAR